MMPTTRIPAAFARRVPAGDVLMDLLVGLVTGGAMWLPPQRCAEVTCRKTTQVFKRVGPRRFVCLGCAREQQEDQHR